MACAVECAAGAARAVDPVRAIKWSAPSSVRLRLVGHSGAVSGYRATMIFEPKTRTGAVVMWNSNWGIPFRIPFAVLDSYHKRAGSRWLDLNGIPLPVPETPVAEVSVHPS